MAPPFKVPQSQPAGRIRPPPSQPEKLTSTEHPLFCFKYLRKSYDLDSCEKDDKCLVLEALIRAANQRWVELECRPHDKGGLEKIPSAQLKDGCPKEFIELDRVHVLRFRRGGRIVGYRQGQVFHVVWVDSGHALYKG